MDHIKKAIAWLSMFSILLAGCYSHTILTPDSPQSAYEVTFRLKDGSYILSHEYQRVEGGYNVVGKLIDKGNKTDTNFSGIVSDENINEVVTNESDKGRTILAVLAGVGLVLVTFGLAVNASMNQ